MSPSCAFCSQLTFLSSVLSSFFFTRPATSEIYTLSLHDALPISDRWAALIGAWSILRGPCLVVTAGTATTVDVLDRKSTRLNSSHTVISYAVFCLKKKIQRAHVASCSIQWAEEYRNAAVVDTVTF